MFGVELLVGAAILAASGAIDNQRSRRRQRARVQVAYEEFMRHQSAVMRLHEEISRAEREVYQAEVDEYWGSGR
jgi:hypothetical protein